MKRIPTSVISLFICELLFFTVYNFVDHIIAVCTVSYLMMKAITGESIIIEFNYASSFIYPVYCLLSTLSSSLSSLERPKMTFCIYDVTSTNVLFSE